MLDIPHSYTSQPAKGKRMEIKVTKHESPLRYSDEMDERGLHKVAEWHVSNITVTDVDSNRSVNIYAEYNGNEWINERTVKGYSINWGAYGSVNAAQAEDYAKLILKAVKVARSEYLKLNK